MSRFPLVCKQDNAESIVRARRARPEGRYCRCGAINYKADEIGWYTVGEDMNGAALCASCWTEYHRHETMWSDPDEYYEYEDPDEEF